MRTHRRERWSLGMSFLACTCAAALGPDARGPISTVHAGPRCMSLRGGGASRPVRLEGVAVPACCARYPCVRLCLPRCLLRTRMLEKSQHEAHAAAQRRQRLCVPCLPRGAHLVAPKAEMCPLGTVLQHDIACVAGISDSRLIGFSECCVGTCACGVVPVKCVATGSASTRRCLVSEYLALTYSLLLCTCLVCSCPQGSAGKRATSVRRQRRLARKLECGPKARDAARTGHQELPRVDDGVRGR